jgi:hypothetical protein
MASILVFFAAALFLLCDTVVALENNTSSAKPSFVPALGECRLHCGGSQLAVAAEVNAKDCTVANAPEIFNVLPRCPYSVEYVSYSSMVYACNLVCGDSILATIQDTPIDTCQTENAEMFFANLPSCDYRLAPSDKVLKGRCVAFCDDVFVGNVEVESQEICGTTNYSRVYATFPTCSGRRIQYVPPVLPDGTFRLCQSFCGSSYQDSQVVATAAQCTPERAHEVFRSGRCSFDGTFSVKLFTSEL